MPQHQNILDFNRTGTDSFVSGRTNPRTPRSTFLKFQNDKRGIQNGVYKESPESTFFGFGGAGAGTGFSNSQKKPINANPLQRKIQFYDEYVERQMSVPGGLIDQKLFDTLAGTGNIRLGSGFSEKERKALEFTSNERLNRKALKRQFEIAELRGEGNYGLVRYGAEANSAPVPVDQNISGLDPRPVSQEDTWLVSGSIAAGGIVAGAAVGATVAAAGAGIAVTGGAMAGAAAGAMAGAMVAGPIAIVAIVVMLIMSAIAKKKARDKKRKLRTLGAGQTFVESIRGYTPTGALLSREGAMRIASGEAKSKEST